MFYLILLSYVVPLSLLPFALPEYLVAFLQIISHIKSGCFYHIVVVIVHYVKRRVK